MNKTVNNPIEDWIKKCMDNMLLFENREIAVRNDTDEIVSATWIIKCLANPNCEGSEEVLRMIQERRDAVKHGLVNVEEEKDYSWSWQFVSLLNEGKQPIIEFTDDAFDLDEDCGLEKSMKARVIKVEEVENGWMLYCDFNEFEEENKQFEMPNYIDNNEGTLVGWSKTKYYPKDKVEKFKVRYADLLPFKIIES